MMLIIRLYKNLRREIKMKNTLQQFQYFQYVTYLMEICNFLSTVITHKLVIKYFANHIQRVNTKISINWWIRIEPHRLSPDEFLDIFFSEHWFLKVKTERSGTYRFLIDIMQRCHVWMTQSLINCKAS